MGGSKQKWTVEEEFALRQGVTKYGKGKWRAMQKDPELGPILANRSNIDLKDKWRNLNIKMPLNKSSDLADSQDCCVEYAEVEVYYQSCDGYPSYNEDSEAQRHAVIDHVLRAVGYTEELGSEEGDAAEHVAAKHGACSGAQLQCDTSSHGSLKRRWWGRDTHHQEVDSCPSSAGMDELAEIAELSLEAEEHAAPCLQQLQQAGLLAGCRATPKTEPLHDSVAPAAAASSKHCSQAGEWEEGLPVPATKRPRSRSPSQAARSPSACGGRAAGAQAAGHGGEQQGPCPEDMVIAAVACLNPNGSQVEEVHDWIEAHYSVASPFRGTVDNTLRRLSLQGRLATPGSDGCCYRLAGLQQRHSDCEEAVTCVLGPVLGCPLAEAARAAAEAAAEEAERAAQLAAAQLTSHVMRSVCACRTADQQSSWQCIASAIYGGYE